MPWAALPRLADFYFFLPAMGHSLTIFLLSAGLGTRLKPLTDRVPKPLIPFQGRSALEINLKKLVALPALQGEVFDRVRVICNAHHLPDPIKHEARRLGIEVFHEEAILGTGGCLAFASRRLQESDYFMVHNADILHALDLEKLIEQHVKSPAMGTLAAVFHPSVNTLSLGEHGTLLGIHGFHEFDSRPEISRATFAGIALYDSTFLNAAPGPGYSDIKQWWAGALASGEKLQLRSYGSDPWFDFGTPRGLWRAARWYMEQTGNYSYKYLPQNPEDRPYVANEANILGLPSGLENLILFELPAIFPEKGSKNRILGSDFEWEIEETALVNRPRIR